MTTVRQQILVMAICAAAAAAFVFAVVPAAIVEPKGVPGIALSPRFLPTILGVLVLILSLIGLMKAVSEVGADDGGRSSVARFDFSMLLPAVALALLVGTVLTVPFAGMRSALVVGSIVLLLLGGEKRLWVLALAGIALPIAATWLFEAVFHVPVPPSRWFG